MKFIFVPQEFFSCFSCRKERAKIFFTPECFGSVEEQVNFIVNRRKKTTMKFGLNLLVDCHCEEDFGSVLTDFLTKHWWSKYIEKTNFIKIVNFISLFLFFPSKKQKSSVPESQVRSINRKPDLDVVTKLYMLWFQLSEKSFKIIFFGIVLIADFPVCNSLSVIRYDIR